ncbi:MAG: phage recombination protein Bet [Segetibacter sp.]|nr:phage recombination protein Bet [Segetibacter sp.]
MSTEIQKVEEINEAKLVSYLDAMGLTKSLTVTEKTQYIEICKAYQLNPFKREIHVTKYGDNFSIVVGYETYLKRAERSNQLDGWDVSTTGEVSADGKSGLVAYITIYRKDRKYPFKHEVHLSEYVGTTKEGNVTKFWKKPITMLKKVVTAQGFRLCFPDEMGGMPYIEEEISNEAIKVIKLATEPITDEQKEEIKQLLKNICFKAQMVIKTTEWLDTEADSKSATRAIEKLKEEINKFNDQANGPTN